MDELMDMIAADDSASQVSDKIKDILFAKSAEKIDAYRPNVANSLFGDQESADEVDAVVANATAVASGQDQSEVETEVDTEVEDEAEE